MDQYTYKLLFFEMERDSHDYTGPYLFGESLPEREQWSYSEGVHRYFREPRGILPFATGTNKVFFCAPGAIPLYVDSLRAIATKTVEHDFLGARVLCCNFAPLHFTERVGKDERWRAVKDRGPIRIARRAYHPARAACSAFRERLANAIWHLVN